MLHKRKTEHHSIQTYLLLSKKFSQKSALMKRKASLMILHDQYVILSHISTIKGHLIYSYYLNDERANQHLSHGEFHHDGYISLTFKQISKPTCVIQPSSMLFDKKELKRLIKASPEPKLIKDNVRTVAQIHPKSVVTKIVLGGLNK